MLQICYQSNCKLSWVIRSRDVLFTKPNPLRVLSENICEIFFRGCCYCLDNIGLYCNCFYSILFSRLKHSHCMCSRLVGYWKTENQNSLAKSVMWQWSNQYNLSLSTAKVIRLCCVLPVVKKKNRQTRVNFKQFQAKGKFDLSSQTILANIYYHHHNTVFKKAWLLLHGTVCCLATCISTLLNFTCKERV